MTVKKKAAVTLSLLAAIVLFKINNVAAQLLLVNGGSSAYSIVVPAAATATETKAAAVLKKYFKAVSGADLPIVKETAFKGSAAIFIGGVSNAAATSLVSDGYHIYTGNNALFINGGKGKGVLYGAYAFTEEVLHCHKYDAGAAVTPQSKEISVPVSLDITAQPAFQYRESYNLPALDNEYLDWHRLQRFEELWGLWGHSYFKLVPPALHFKTHPEYFAQVSGQRQATQLCLSNAAVLRIVIEQLRLKMADNPDALYWSVAPNDEGGYCTCLLCSKADAEEGSPSGSLIRFVNKVAAAFPDKNITTLGYGYTAHAPKQTRPADNVYVFVSSIDAYREQPLAQAGSAAAFRKDLKAWADVTANIFVWDYATQFTAYLAPFPDQQNRAADYQWFRDNKVKGVFEQGGGDTYSDMAELNTYLQARLLWDVHADATALQQEFCTGYYGDAAPLVLQYLDKRAQALKSSGRHLDIYGNPISALNSYLAPELIDAYDQLLEQAAQTVAGTLYEPRVARIRLGLDYAVLQQSRFFGPDAHGFLEDKGAASFSIKAAWIKKVAAFTAAATRAGVKELSEGGLTPAQYAAEWQNLFDQVWPRNIALGATLRLDHPYAEDYPAKGLRTLTDGMTGFTDFSYNWLCFYGNDLGAVIDLQQAKSWNKISINFLDDQRHWIFLPSKVRVELSDDGVTYRDYAPAQQPPMTETSKAQVHTLTFSGKASARYIRVTAVNPGVLPAWHAHPSKKPMICCDEVMVL